MRRHPGFRAMAFVGTLAVGATLAACGNSEPTAGTESDGDPIQLVMAVETNPGDPLADMLNLFADALEEELGDQVEVETHLGGSIGDETAILGMLRAGEIDVAVVGSDISTLDPIFGIMELPFLFSARETVTAFLDGDFGREMSDSLEQSAGLRVLSYGENGFRHITNNVRPVTTPEDLSGLKLRVPEVPARVTMFETFGAVPTPMSIDEVYLALDQGVLDGQENPLKVIDAFSFHEVQQYLSLSGHVYSPASLTMSLDTWDSLPAEIQDAVDGAAAEAAQGSRELGIEADESLIAQFEEAGVEINEADIAAFQEQSSQVWEGAKDEVGEDFVDRVVAEYGE